MSKQGALQVLNGQNTALTFNQAQVELVKRTVAKNATDDELQMFLYLAQQYNLDPFKKEIWFIKYDSNPTIQTSRDGYLKIAINDPNFDGLKSFVVKEGDEFSIDATTDQVIHKFGAKRGKIIGAWAMACHKQRKPVICFVDFNEYNQNNNVWKKYPSAMIQKVAESFVLKRQFNINGLVTQEELNGPDAIDIDYHEYNERQQQSKGRGKGVEYYQMPYIVGKERGLTEEDIKLLIYKFYRVDSAKDLTEQQVNEFCNDLRDTPQENMANIVTKLRDIKAKAEAKKAQGEAEQQGAESQEQAEDFNPGEVDFNIDEIDQGIKNLQNQPEPEF